MKCLSRIGLHIGYYLVGSLLMLVHDVSDIPLDLLRVFMLLKWDLPMVSTLNVGIKFTLYRYLLCCDFYYVAVLHST
jgi:hypothetical protein